MRRNNRAPETRPMISKLLIQITCSIAFAIPALADNEDVIRMVSHNPPFGFSSELASVLEDQSNFVLSQEWSRHEEANLIVFFIADEGQFSREALPVYAQDVLDFLAIDPPTFSKYFDANNVEDGRRIGIAFFNTSELDNRVDLACVSARHLRFRLEGVESPNGDDILSMCED